MAWLQTVSSIGLNIGIMIGGILLVGGLIIAGLFIYTRWKRYKEFTCVIWDAGKITESYDQAGIFIDSYTKNKRFFLKKANVGMDPDNVPYKMTSKGKTVYLLREGLKNFKFIDINTAFDDIGIKITVGEEDVNWAINAYEKQKKLFSQTLLMQLLPYIALAFVSIIILVIFIYFFKDFDVLRDVAINLKEASLACNSGTIIS